MPKSTPSRRERAFRLRIQRKAFTEVSKELGVSTKTLSRWENGWTDKAGHSHEGWKSRLEKAWRALSESELQYGLILKEQRLKTYEELAQMAVAKVKEMFPHIRGRTAADAKAILSEIRELMKLIAQERGEYCPGPQTVVAVKTEISLGDLQERYLRARGETVVTQSGQEDERADRLEGDPEPGGDRPVALNE